jgi:Na+-transporting NADH:ubiquinone oxidoreductase subunit C
MNRDSNIYTIVYASVMVILVAFGLAFTSQSLKSYQKKNEDIDKMKQILRSVRVQATAENAESLYK